MDHVPCPCPMCMESVCGLSEARESQDGNLCYPQFNTLVVGAGGTGCTEIGGDARIEVVVYGGGGGREDTRSVNVFPNAFPDQQPTEISIEMEKKSIELLHQKIGKKLTKQLKEKGCFEVKGKYGIYRFKLGKDDSGGVQLIHTTQFGKKKITTVRTLCIQPKVGNMTKGDIVLARYLFWLADEDEFLRVANFRDAFSEDEAGIIS